MSLIDAHNHLQDVRLGGPEEIISTMRENGVTRCVVNATCEEDWGTIAKLAARHPALILPAYGVHPWKAHQAEPGWEERLAERLRKQPEASIGECGLDQWIESPPIGLQQRVFEQHLALANELHRTVTIHCLKAWEFLFASLKRVPLSPPFLLHSFNGSHEIAERLIPLGAYFSFSGYFLHPRKQKVMEVFKKLPRDRILIETDAPDMTPPDKFVRHPLPNQINHPANLPEIAAGLASALGASLEDLAKTTVANFQRCFGSNPT